MVSHVQLKHPKKYKRIQYLENTATSSSNYSEMQSVQIEIKMSYFYNLNVASMFKWIDFVLRAQQQFAAVEEPVYLKQIKYSSISRLSLQKYMAILTTLVECKIREKLHPNIHSRLIAGRKRTNTFELHSHLFSLMTLIDT